MASRDDAKVRSDPSRMIVRENSATSAGFKIPFRKPAADRFRHAAKLGVGVAFNAIAPLDLYSRVCRPALSALAKAFVKSWHAGSGSIPENTYRRSVPGRAAGQLTSANHGLRVDVS